MSEELKPVHQDPIAGEGAPAEVKTEPEAEQDKPALGETVITDALAVLEESDKALAAAEKRIIRDKRKVRAEKEGDEVDFEERVREEVARQLEATRPREDDVELKSIQAQREKNAQEKVRLA